MGSAELGDNSLRKGPISHYHFSFFCPAKASYNKYQEKQTLMQHNFSGYHLNNYELKRPCAP